MASLTDPDGTDFGFTYDALNPHNGDALVAEYDAASRPSPAIRTASFLPRQLTADAQHL